MTGGRISVFFFLQGLSNISLTLQLKMVYQQIMDTFLSFPEHRVAPVENGCGQGCVQMILSKFEGQDETVDTLNQICGVKVEGAFSSTLDIANGMVGRGYDVVRISDIPSRELYQDPRKFMKCVGFDPGEDSPIIEARRRSASIFFDNVSAGKIIEHVKSPDTGDIHNYLAEGYGLIAWVNSRGLAGDFTRTSGHYVVPLKVSDSDIFFHDPGGFDDDLGQIYGVSSKACKDFFEKAMQYPSAAGLNSETGLPRRMGLLAFYPGADFSPGR